MQVLSDPPNCWAIKEKYSSGYCFSMLFPTGKVSEDILREIILKKLGAPRRDVLLGPKIGEDAAALRVGRRLLVASSDPITGAVKRIGWLAVHINANDIATMGAAPLWFLSSLLFPKNATTKLIREICRQIDQAAGELNAAVVGGHCEFVPGLQRPLVIGCMMGLTEDERYVRSGGARSGDRIILSKGAGMEGTAIIASERQNDVSKHLGSNFLKRALSYFKQISVVKEALIAFHTGGVNSMHDPTEGGILRGLHEIADASKAGFIVYEDTIPIGVETASICRLFKIDPLQLIGAGALLISSKPEYATKILRALRSKGIKANMIGEITGRPRERVMIRRDGSVSEIQCPPSDHLWKALVKPVKSSK